MLRDFDTFRQFITGSGIHAIFDLPWAPIYIAVIFVLYPLLGALALGCSITPVLMSPFIEWIVKPPLAESNEAATRSCNFTEMSLRNTEVVRAMGMTAGLLKRWCRDHARMLERCRVPRTTQRDVKELRVREGERVRMPPVATVLPNEVEGEDIPTVQRTALDYIVGPLAKDPFRTRGTTDGGSPAMCERSWARTEGKRVGASLRGNATTRGMTSVDREPLSEAGALEQQFRAAMHRARFPKLLRDRKREHLNVRPPVCLVAVAV
jgi:hypothetical protein